ncbi:hypothetical protein C451_11995 [Halococcus thailandensis JCM 13552]|uniref:Uncharacterized protein n=1 Tax=Halococcus thailandensis JCM 13552 TaxID=1227457 RepID=M0N2U0_9EURY|nr:hypothetical protein C451_11995 [Halococcus thailandensis JCM 13552]
MAGRRRERLAVEREPLVGHRHRRGVVEDGPGDVRAARPRALGVVLAERFEIDVEHLPLGGPLEAPREFSFLESGGPLVATALDRLLAGLDVGTDVVDGAGVEIHTFDGVRLRDVATLGADRAEGDVVVVDLLLILCEHVPCLLAVFEQVVNDVVERTGFVAFGVRDGLDGDIEQFGAPLDQIREMCAVRLTAAEGIGDRGVGLAEVAAERAGVDLAEPDDVTVEVGELAGHLPERIAIVGGEDLSDRPAPLAESLGDEVAACDLVHVAEMGDARRRDAALDDDRVVGLALVDHVGDGFGPEIA